MIDVRRAVARDADEVTRLRREMLQAIGRDVDSDGGWERACAAAFIELLPDPDFVTFVVDAPGGHLAGCVTVWIDRRLPGPHFDGRVGYVANMSTDPPCRRRGIGSALIAAALRWFEQQGVQRVDLHASDEGRPVYERAGFKVPPWVAMRWHPSPPDARSR